LLADLADLADLGLNRMRRWMARRISWSNMVFANLTGRVGGVKGVVLADLGQPKMGKKQEVCQWFSFVLTRHCLTNLATFVKNKVNSRKYGIGSYRVAIRWQTSRARVYARLFRSIEDLGKEVRQLWMGLADMA